MSMKKILFYGGPILLAVILCLSLGSSFPSCAVDSLFDKRGAPEKKVSKVFEHLGVSVSSLDQANEFAQKNLLRKGERWDTQEENEWHAIIHDKKYLLLNDLKALGMIDSVEPQQKNYTYVLVMGTITGVVAKRLDYLAELKQNGILFRQIVLLGSERPLRDNEKYGLPKEISTEAQMMKHLCDNHCIFENDNIIVVNAPMIKHNDGTFIRPNTDDTIAYFAKIAPEDGSCLVISNNPYVLRQTKVTQRILDQVRFPTEGAGKKVNQETIDIVMLMDEFARTIYEEYRQAKGNLSKSIVWYISSVNKLLPACYLFNNIFMYIRSIRFS